MRDEEERKTKKLEEIIDGFKSMRIISILLNILDEGGEKTKEGKNSAMRGPGGDIAAM